MSIRTGCVALLFALLLPWTAAADYQEGRHYLVLDSEPPAADEPVEVIEFFWYGCGACYQFEPMVEDWKQTLGENVEFRRIPAVLNPRWRVHAQAFFVAESLGVTDTMHRHIFNSIHQQRQLFDSREAMRELFVEQGVAAEDFDAAWGSFAVDSQMRRAATLARRYEIRATPSLVVGEHYVSNPSSAGGLDELIGVADHLLEQIDE